MPKHVKICRNILGNCFALFYMNVLRFFGRLFCCCPAFCVLQNVCWKSPLNINKIFFCSHIKRFSLYIPRHVDWPNKVIAPILILKHYCLDACLSVCLSLCLSVCLSVCLYVLYVCSYVCLVTLCRRKTTAKTVLKTEKRCFLCPRRGKTFFFGHYSSISRLFKKSEAGILP